MNVLAKGRRRKGRYDEITIGSNVSQSVDVRNGRSVREWPPNAHRRRSGHLTGDHSAWIIEKVHFRRWLHQKAGSMAIGGGGGVRGWTDAWRARRWGGGRWRGGGWRGEGKVVSTGEHCSWENKMKKWLRNRDQQQLFCIVKQEFQ